MIDISQSTVGTLYPKCKTKINVQLKQIEQQKTVTCSSCGSKIELVDKDESAKKAVKNVNKEFSGLQDTIRKIGK